MNYLKGSFSVALAGEKYRDGWERIFGPAKEGGGQHWGVPSWEDEAGECTYRPCRRRKCKEEKLKHCICHHHLELYKELSK